MAASCRENPAVAVFRAYRNKSIEEIEAFINGEIRLIDAYLHSPSRTRENTNFEILLMKIKMIRGARAALKHKRRK